MNDTIIPAQPGYFTLRYDPAKKLSRRIPVIAWSVQGGMALPICPGTVGISANVYPDGSIRFRGNRFASEEEWTKFAETYIADEADVAKVNEAYQARPEN
jgi:hypothetical protein